MKIERFIKDEVVRKAKAAGWFCRPLTWTGQKDAPDHFFLKDARVVLIEFKSPGEKLRPGQERELQEIKAHGGTVVRCGTIESALRALGLGE